MLFILDSQIQLQSDLKNFGLNPTDWKILKDKSRDYKIQSKQDRNFVFKGRAQKKGARIKWQQIELISI